MIRSRKNEPGFISSVTSRLAQYSPKPIPRGSWKLRPRQIAREMSRPVSTIQNALGKLQASNRVANPNHGKYVVYELADETRQSLC
jgi:hypothetical protein